MLKFFDADPGSGMEKIQIRDGKFGSATLGCWIRIRSGFIGKTAGKEEYDVLRYFEMKMSEFCRKFKPPMPKCVMGTAFHYFKVSAFTASLGILVREIGG
jgi:hypothetical protein